jgi:hypothetical protein
MNKNKGINYRIKSLFSEIGILQRGSLNIIKKEGFVSYLKIACGMPVFFTDGKGKAISAIIHRRNHQFGSVFGIKNIPVSE